MILTEAPTLLDENLQKVTPWWDIFTKYLIAVMMAITLTSIAVQVTKDNLICIPAIDCSNLTMPKENGSLAADVSDDVTKSCQSLTSKSLKKKVLSKMVDRRLYDYVDSVCFQELSWFTKFFPLILLVEVVLLLALDILWTKLPFSSSVLNHFVSLAEEGYSSLATIDILRKGLPKQDESNGEAQVSPPPMNQGTDLSKISAPIPDADALKVLNLVEKAEQFRIEYANEGSESSSDQKNFYCLNISLHHFYKMRTSCQLFLCFVSLAVNLADAQNFFSFSNTVHFKCVIDEIVFTKEYEHFECSHPLAPYFQFTLILFLIFLVFHFVTSSIAVYQIFRYGTSYTFPDNSKEEATTDEKEKLRITSNDFAFLFYLLTKHDKLYADRVSYFFRPWTSKNLPGNILRYMSKNK